MRVLLSTIIIIFKLFILFSSSILSKSISVRLLWSLFSIAARPNTTILSTITVYYRVLPAYYRVTTVSYRDKKYIEIYSNIEISAAHTTQILLTIYTILTILLYVCGQATKYVLNFFAFVVNFLFSVRCAFASFKFEF